MTLLPEAAIRLLVLTRIFYRLKVHTHTLFFSPRNVLDHFLWLIIPLLHLISTQLVYLTPDFSIRRLSVARIAIL